MGKLNLLAILTAMLLLPGVIECANVVIFSMISRSQLLSVSRIAEILAEDGHKPTIVAATNDLPDIKLGPKYDILTFETDLPRETEEDVGKQALAFSPKNIIMGKVPTTKPEIFGSRCRGFLLNEEFLAKFDALKPDVAIIHSLMGCFGAHLYRKGIPYLDFCSMPLLPSLCGAPHRVPTNPSYVPDFFFSGDEMSFMERVVNTVVTALAPRLLPKFVYGRADAAVAEYQTRHNLPREDVVTLRSKSSFVLVHGDVTFETIRPTMPKVVYIGGIQCDAPRPLMGDLKDFVDGSGEAGIVVFSLGGVLDTSALPHNFVDNFFGIFRKLPQRVIWKLKDVPAHLVEKKPCNVMLVDWLPQQDLLGHPKTKLFISHGGIQGSFESICHGKALLGIGLFGDQFANLRILTRKGMAIMVEDYNNLDPNVIEHQISQLLNDPKYANAALEAQTLFRDQPQTPAQRLQHAVAYTLRHNGAHHLTSKASMQLYWFQYCLVDVALFIGSLVIIAACLVYFCLKKCWRCCCSSKKAKEE